MSDLDVLALNDFDRRFMAACGVEVPSDAAWPLDGDERDERKDVLILSSPKPTKRRTTFELSILNPDVEGGFSDPEAAQ